MITLLIPTDFSDSARNALEYAIALYGKDQKYLLFNAYEEPHSSASSMVSLKDILHESSIDSLKEEVEEILKKHPGLNIEWKSEYGGASESIMNYARLHDVDVIVMGTTGASGIRKMILGSSAAEVLHNASVPVIVVPSPFAFQVPKNVLFTSDLTGSESEKLNKVFTYFVDKHNSKITILTVKDEGSEVDKSEANSQSGLHQMMNGYNHSFEVIFGDDVDDAIREYADQKQMNMLVTTPHKSNWFSQLFNPSVSKNLTEELRIPLMAMH